MAVFRSPCIPVLFLLLSSTDSVVAQPTSSSDLHTTLQAEDEKFRTGSFEVIWEYPSGTKDSESNRHFRFRFNSATEYCVEGIYPKNLCTNCFYKGTEFSYEKQSQSIELPASQMSVYERNNPLLGDHPGACLALGRGLSYVAEVHSEGNSGAELVFLGSKPSLAGNPLVVRGTVDPRHHYLLKTARLYFSGELAQEWECTRFVSTKETAYCTDSTIKRYRHNKLVSTGTLRVRNADFGTRQKMDILNSVPRRSVSDNRFGTDVTYDTLPRHIDLDKLTAESQRRAEHQIRSLERGQKSAQLELLTVVLRWVILLALGGITFLLVRRWRRSKFEQR